MVYVYRGLGPSCMRARVIVSYGQSYPFNLTLSMSLRCGPTSHLLPPSFPVFSMTTSFLTPMATKGAPGTVVPLGHGRAELPHSHGVPELLRLKHPAYVAPCHGGASEHASEIGRRRQLRPRALVRGGSGARTRKASSSGAAQRLRRRPTRSMR
jgi:hypothetical protein